MGAYENYRAELKKRDDCVRCRYNERCKEQDYTSQRKQKQSQLSSCKSKKKSDERRLDDVKDILKVLDKKGGWFSSNVPDAISAAQHALTELDESFRKSMKLTGGRAASNMESAFKVKSVRSDRDSSDALSEYERVCRELEQNVSELDRTIKNLNTSISQLSQKIRSCQSRQNQLSREIRDHEYWMSYRKKRI